VARLSVMPPALVPAERFEGVLLFLGYARADQPLHPSREGRPRNREHA
jgi:hypothetical protein